MEWDAVALWDAERGNFGIKLRPRAKEAFRAHVKEHGQVRVTITDDLPESGQLRRFYHGAVIRLWAHLDGKDHHKKDVCDAYHEYAKLAFNGEVIEIGGQPMKVGRSSKGAKLREFVEKIIDYLEEQYGIDRSQCLNPEEYKRFIETVFMHGEYEDYIAYCVAMGRLKTNQTA